MTTPDTATRHRHLADAANKADLALRALGHGDYHGAAVWAVGVTTSVEQATDGDIDSLDGYLHTAAWHLDALYRAVTKALNAYAAVTREDEQAGLFVADAKLHFDSAQGALAHHEAGPR